MSFGGNSSHSFLSFSSCLLWWLTGLLLSHIWCFYFFILFFFSLSFSVFLLLLCCSHRLLLLIAIFSPRSSTVPGPADRRPLWYSAGSRAWSTDTMRKTTEEMLRFPTKGLAEKAHPDLLFLKWRAERLCDFKKRRAVWEKWEQTKGGSGDKESERENVKWERGQGLRLQRGSGGLGARKRIGGGLKESFTVEQRKRRKRATYYWISTWGWKTLRLMTVKRQTLIIMIIILHWKECKFKRNAMSDLLMTCYLFLDLYSIW